MRNVSSPLRQLGSEFKDDWLARISCACQWSIRHDGQTIRCWYRSGGRIDPDVGRKRWWCRRSTHETFRMGLIRRQHYMLSCRDRLHRLATMNGGRREQSDPTVIMIMVVPLKERTCPRAGIC